MLSETDQQLAVRYGAYASFPMPVDPIAMETHGDAPSDEVDRLLNIFATPTAHVLDLGCGAGQTLCRLAPLVAEIWGVDLEEPLLNGAKERAAQFGLTNASFLHGDTTHTDTVSQLPDSYFDFAFSRRGPFLTSALLPKLTPDAHFLVEMYQDILGLKEIFGRNPFLPSDNYPGADGCISHHAGIGLQPVSVKHYYYEMYFRDADHLAGFLSVGAWLSNWWMPACSYDPTRDRSALELYTRYNTTEKGVRVIQHRKVYLFRRASKNYYPVLGDL